MTATRRELVDLLTLAAEVEHSLVCQYLFAAFTLKQTEDEGLTPEQVNQVVRWERFILMVARQEMEHLGLACNLLTAIGGMPNFQHPRFPYYTPMWGHQMELLPFGEDALRRFVCYERPEEVEPEDAFCVEKPGETDIGDGSPLHYRDVGELYKRVRAVLTELAASDTDLFLEGASEQVTGFDLGTDFPRVGAMGGGYDVFLSPITNLQSALAAIDLITEQGEGSAVAGDLGHYRVFLDILEQLQQADFDPARNVAANPVLFRQHGDDGVTVIDHPLSRMVLELFIEAYNVMLLILIRLFAHTDETTADIEQLRAAGFFPMMTMVIRPLSEILTTLPAHPESDLRAGPGFALEPGLKFLPHSSAAWVVLGERLDQLVAKAAATAAMDGAPPRLGFIAESIELMTRRFKTELATTDA